MADRLPKNYDAATLERIVHSLEKRIDALQRPKLRRIKSVAADAAQNLAVNEPGYVLDDTGQFFDFVVRGEDSRLYRISGQASAVAATPSSPAGVYVLKSGDTMTGLLLLSADPSAALGAATKQYADTKVADTGDTMTGALFVDGSADAIQGRFQGNGTQTNPVIQVENSSAAAQIKFQVDGGAVFNEAGNGGSADFRVETDNDANALFVDASADELKIGSSTKFGWGVTAVSRPSALTQTFSTAERTHASRSAATLTDNIGGTTGTTLAAIPDPADTPLTADSLRDDITSNILPVLRNILSSLALQHNNSKTDSDDTAQFVNSLTDDLQSEGWLQ